MQEMLKLGLVDLAVACSGGGRNGAASVGHLGRATEILKHAADLRANIVPVTLVLRLFLDPLDFCVLVLAKFS